MAGIVKMAPENKCQGQSSLEECSDTLGDVHDEKVWGAIERLVQVGEQVGFSVHDLIRMLKGGVSLEVLLDLIEVRMTDKCLHLESRVA
jgi:hypothetical protein